MRVYCPAILPLLVIGLMRLTAAQVPTFKVTAKEVRIDILVADKEKPVTGLKAADFEVRDNGVRQEIRYISFEQIPINAMLILDMSRSVAGETLANLKNAAGALLKELKKNERAALITFGQAVKLGSPLTADLQSVKAALDATEPFGNTSVIDASYAGLILAESTSERPLLIVFSDGLDTFSWLTREDVLETAKQADTVVYAVSAGRLPNRAFLHELTILTGGSLFEVDSAANLEKVFVEILEEFRHRYCLTYIPQGVSKTGWHALKVRVKGKYNKVTYRPGYMSDPTQN